MNRIICWAIIFLNCIVSAHFSQEKMDAILEKVQVVNVEVPVRVVYKGKPVKNLNRSDFSIYEDGKLQTINAFFQVTKKIDSQDYKLKAKKDEKTIHPSRYFVLIFSLTEYNENLEKGLAYTFKNILEEKDQLLVLINSKTKFYSNLKQKQIVQKEIKKLLYEEGKTSKHEMNILFNQIERKIKELKFLLESRIDDSIDKTEIYLKRFLNQYYHTWKDFKIKYLTPDIDKFYNFSKHLENIKKEKWVINFYQIPLFPQINQTSETLKQLVDIMKTRKFHNIFFNLKSEIDFPTEDISKLFYKVNATFHSIFIPVHFKNQSEDIEFKNISTALESCFREITKKTGGTLVSSANLVTALDTIIEKEDVYYMLTYRPQDPKKIGKIKVELLNINYRYKVQYDKNIRADYIQAYLERKKVEIPETKIKQINFKDHKLSLIISDFLLKTEKKKSVGKINIGIRIEDSSGEIIYDENKKLNPRTETTSISIDFNWLKPGRYYILVDILDELTGKFYPDYIQTEISETCSTMKKVDFKEDLIEQETELDKDNFLISKELEKYLNGAEKYCERLKSKAFHFFCKEKVTVTFTTLAPQSPNNLWKSVRNKLGPRSKTWEKRQSTKKYLFDYQLLNNKGKIKEQRILESGNSKDHKKFPHKDPVFSFLSERAVFGPNTLLSEINQKKFKYSILKSKQLENRDYIIVKVIPINLDDMIFDYSEAWIDKTNFSVRKIFVSLSRIIGQEKLKERAELYKARLYLNCEIEYNQEYKEIMFPTKVTIIEKYKGGPIINREFGYKGWERTRTIFKYSDYQFFNVSMEFK